MRLPGAFEELVMKTRRALWVAAMAALLTLNLGCDAGNGANPISSTADADAGNNQPDATVGKNDGQNNDQHDGTSGEGDNSSTQDTSVAEVEEEVKGDPCEPWKWLLELNPKWECPAAATGEIQLKFYEKDDICITDSKLFGPFPAKELECDKKKKEFTFFSSGHNKKVTCVPYVW